MAEQQTWSPVGDAGVIAGLVTGMPVVDADGREAGVIREVRGHEVLLARAGGSVEPLSLARVQGVRAGRVLLRGDTR